MPQGCRLNFVCNALEFEDPAKNMDHTGVAAQARVYYIFGWRRVPSDCVILTFNNPLSAEPHLTAPPLTAM